jgi:hypothetical protein
MMVGRSAGGTISWRIFCLHLLDCDHIGKTRVNLGLKKQPNRWITLRGLRVLKAVSG